ncbi:universal stress protein [Mycobacterium sp. E3198]|uniref:universal stress protein n=1 Tax=Mycobacterium sp. E3198 TaxID=1834143 RepID=UPI0007FFDFC6|nr:universal stress protein [Mycobacterium sp. E3198]OBG34700.1 universal stress protein UspA [Mycobacterium sp. E3198]
MTGGKRHFGVVVGVDGSAPSDAAVRWAAGEAVLRKRRLTLVNAIAAPALPWPAAPAPAKVRRREELDSRTMVDRAVSIAEDTSKANRVEIETRSLHSAPAPTLVDMSKDADMVVVGARGLRAARGVSLGSVSTGLIHHAYCPVAVIHHDSSAQPRAAHDSVLVGIDGSRASELATAIAFEEASLRGASLVALHAWRDADMAHLPSMEEGALKSAAEETLAERLAGWRESYPDVNIARIVEYDRPASHLLERSELAQLVVVGSRGRGGFAGMLLGSVSTAVAQAARTPVIVARSQ